MYTSKQHAHPFWPAASCQLIPFLEVWARADCLRMLGPVAHRLILLLFLVGADLSGAPLSPRAAGGRRAVCRRADSRGQERSKNALPSILRPAPPGGKRGAAEAAPANPAGLRQPRLGAPRAAPRSPRAASRQRSLQRCCEGGMGMGMGEPPPRSPPRCALSFTQAFWGCALRRRLPLEMFVMRDISSCGFLGRFLLTAPGEAPPSVRA